MWQNDVIACLKGYSVQHGLRPITEFYPSGQCYKRYDILIKISNRVNEMAVIVIHVIIEIGIVLYDVITTTP